MTTESSPTQTAHELLAETNTCTLATASPDGQPEAATVRFVADDALDVYVTTQSNYRKYRNVADNERVALVVDGFSNLQMEGAAREATGETVEWIEQRYVAKYGSSRYLTNEDSVFLHIETDWARLLVDGSYPPEFASVLDEGESPETDSTR